MPLDPVVTYVPGHLPGYALMVVHYPTQSPDAIPPGLRKFCVRARNGYGYTYVQMVAEAELDPEEAA
jgi:hypothetical protein